MTEKYLGIRIAVNYYDVYMYNIYIHRYRPVYIIMV